MTMSDVSRIRDVKNISATFEAILNALRSESLIILHAVRRELTCILKLLRHLHMANV